MHVSPVLQRPPGSAQQAYWSQTSRCIKARSHIPYCPPKAAHKSAIMHPVTRADAKKDTKRLLRGVQPYHQDMGAHNWRYDCRTRINISELSCITAFAQNARQIPSGSACPATMSAGVPHWRCMQAAVLSNPVRKRADCTRRLLSRHR